MRHGFIKVAAATPSIRVADCSYNTEKIISLIRKAHEESVHLLVLPELCVTGYTCGDLFFQQALIDSAKESIAEICSEVKSNMVVVFGAPVQLKGKLCNCAIVCSAGKILGAVPKTYTADYKEFSESRHFTYKPSTEEYADLGDQKVPISKKLIFCCRQTSSFRLACEIGEDLWVPNSPSTDHALNGATIIASVNASNEYSEKSEIRDSFVQNQSARLKCAYVYSNAGDGESTTDLVFTGRNIICENGSCLAKNSMNEDELLITEIDTQSLEHERTVQNTFETTNDKEYRYIDFDIEIGDTSLTRKISRNPFFPEDKEQDKLCSEEVLTLQALGLKRRLISAHSKTAIIGISGGLDSTLALLVTIRAFKMLSRNLSDIICVTMPCFGTSDKTKNNAVTLSQAYGCTLLTVDIRKSVLQHFQDIGHDTETFDATYENAQARERTQVLMDLANKYNGLVVGTGDLSELALGWATYNGDHMSMYGVNAGVPKTLVKHLVQYVADSSSDYTIRETLLSIIGTPISPELIPGIQETEDLVGPYELHDFFLYYILKYSFSPSKVYRLANYAFKNTYDSETILKWLKTFYRRFFAQQFKRSCLPDGPKVGPVSLSPRGGLQMPSDAACQLWQTELDNSLI